MSTPNPFSAPLVEASEPAAAESAPDSLGTIARSTFLAWEKLRLVYIAILVAETLLLSLLDLTLLATPDFWATAVFGAVLANLCYFVGPILETYVSWLGFRSQVLRIVLFVLGTLLSCLLTFGVMASKLLADMD